MKQLIIILSFLSSCSQPNLINSKALVKSLVNDIVNDGVSVFHWQRTQLGKQNWNLSLADRLLTVEEISLLVGYDVLADEDQRPVAWSTVNKEIDFTELNVPNVKLSPVSISDTTNLKTEILPILKSLQREGLLILSTPFIDKDLQGSDQFYVLAIYYWDNNAVKVLYTLDMKDKEFHILERKVLS